MIHEYFEDYIKWYPERWRWKLKDGQNKRYMETRARRSSSHPYRNNDLLPDFTSIEKDAAQFDMNCVEWTDFFGLTWQGEKGVHAYAGAPDYQGHLYYDIPENDYDERDVAVSDEYDAYDNQPPSDTYAKVHCRHGFRWIDVANISDVEYHYIVDNHLFKDTYIVVNYSDGESLWVFDDYDGFIRSLKFLGKKDILEKIFAKMNEHFIKLRDSEHEDERRYYPGKTAEELFSEDDNR